MGLLGRLFKKGPVRNKEEGSALKRYAKSFFHAIEGFIYCLCAIYCTGVVHFFTYRERKNHPRFRTNVLFRDDYIMSFFIP